MKENPWRCNHCLVWWLAVEQKIISDQMINFVFSVRDGFLQPKATCPALSSARFIAHQSRPTWQLYHREKSVSPYCCCHLYLQLREICNDNSRLLYVFFLPHRGLICDKRDSFWIQSYEVFFLNIQQMVVSYRCVYQMRVKWAVKKSRPPLIPFIR